jgi:hypothetical protein
MSSDKSPPQRLSELAADLLDHVSQEARHHISSRAGASPGRIGGHSTDRLTGPASDGVELAKDIAELVLHTATTVVQDVADAAASLESLVAAHRQGSAHARPPDVPGMESRDPAAAVFTPVALALPAVSPGESTSMAFDVTNHSRRTLDAIRLRCRGLFAQGDARISGRQVKFAPVTVDLLPGSAASVTCTVTVPKTAKRGNYSGLIEAIDLAGVQLLTSLDVV